MPRPHADHRTAPPHGRAARVRRELQHPPPAPITRSAPTRKPHSPALRRDRPTATTRPPRRRHTRVSAGRQTQPSSRYPHGAGAAGQRDRRTLRRQHSPRTPRPHPDHQPTARRKGAPRISTPLQQPTGHTAPSAKPLPSDHSPTRLQARSTRSDGATGSVGCSTSISRSHDVCGVSGTNTLVVLLVHCPLAASALGY